MESEKIINGKRCRYHGGLWFADTGDFVAHYDADCGNYKSCIIYPTVNHGASVEEMFYEEHLDGVVADLFGPTYPHDGKMYDLIHKDGNEKNCDFRNLEWVEWKQIPQPPYHYHNSTMPTEYIRYYHWVLEIGKTGIIKYHGEVIQPYDFDPVLYEEYGEILDIEYYVDVGYEIVLVEQLMAWAGYVQGDDAGLESPSILHRDGNYKNLASDNLEWVEKTDPRFISYNEKKKQDQQARIIELIAQKLLPPDWDKTKPTSSISEQKPIQLPPAPFTPPNFSSFGKDPDVGENPFKPI